MSVDGGEVPAAVRRLVLAATIAVVLLISVGSFVRASGAGLGCPDWPRCFGSWIPPLTAADLPPGYDPAQFNAVKTWTEYLNRLVGVVVGLLAIAAALAAWRESRGAPALAPLRRSTLLGLLLVIVTGWVGGQLPEADLDPRLVSVHLVLALGVLAFYLHACVESFRGTLRRLPPAALDAPRRRFRGLALVALVLTSFQMLQGAVVRGGLELVARAQPDLPRGERLGEVGAVYLLHRETSLVVLALVMLCGLALRRSRGGTGLGATPGLRVTTRITLAVLLLQIAAGIVLAYGGLPPAFQVAHVSAGAWLFGALFLLVMLAGREPAFSRSA